MGAGVGAAVGALVGIAVGDSVGGDDRISPPEKSKKGANCCPLTLSVSVSTSEVASTAASRVVSVCGCDDKG